MANPFTDIGTAESSLNATTLNFTVPAGGVSSGQLIVVFAGCGAAAQSTTATIADSAGNTYTRAITQDTTGTAGFAMFYAFNCSALAAGSTITYTTTANSRKAMAICRSTQAMSTGDPYDSAATNSTTNASSTPTITSGTPTGSNELFIACQCTRGATESLVNPTSWATPPSSTVELSANTAVAGGNITATSASALTWNPTGMSATQGALIITAFKPIPPVVTWWDQKIIDPVPYRYFVIGY